MSDENRRSVREFGLDLKKFLTTTKKKAVKGQAKVTLQILRGCILGCPVDTGRMRAGFVATVGSPSGFVPPNVVDNSRRGSAGIQGAAHLMEGAATLSKIEFGQPTFVVNNVEYSGHVNDRHPKHAGFVQAVVANVESQFIGSRGGGSGDGGAA